MCFSATASFVAGVSLSTVGVATMRKTDRRSEIPFASIPLLFGVQQLIEGMLWLSFQYDLPMLKVTTTYLFTLFSHVLWPVFVPLSISLLEQVLWRKRVIWLFLIMGIAVSLYNLSVIVTYPVISEVNCNIVYALPQFHSLQVIMLYLAATCAGCFFSSHRLIKVFGFLAVVLFLVAYWFYTVAFLSVWCFFAAILSVVIYLHFKFEHERASGLMHILKWA
jgi:hypothetical protein